MRVTLIGTGGTIASRNVDGAVVASVEVADLLATADLDGLTGPGGDVEVTTRDLGTSPSFALSLPEVARIALAACEALESGADAVGLTHGTDSMEETVFLLDLLHAGDQAVAVTGAQRPHDDPDPDGPRNLTDLVRVLASDEARGQGALLVFAGQAWPAVGVRKVHTSDLHAFAAESGPRLEVAGRVDVVVSGRPRRGTVPGALAAVRERGLPAVDVVATVPGSDGTVLSTLLDRGSRGIVLQALGIGNVGPADTEQVRRAVDAGVPVLVTSRVAHGRVQPVYGGGGGYDLHRAGAVFAGTQTTWQARVLLSVALAVDPDHPLDVVRPWLERHDPTPSTHH